tara:strand:+ start:451 stop:753 length:303 start_codon:yes stop_codon:yes gene_type:complete
MHAASLAMVDGSINPIEFTTGQLPIPTRLIRTVATMRTAFKGSLFCQKPASHVSGTAFVTRVVLSEIGIALFWKRIFQARYLFRNWHRTFLETLVTLTFP